MLTIISGAGIMVLVLMPLLVLHRAYTDNGLGIDTDHHYLGAKALLVSLIVVGASISGALALIMIRLFDRYFRG